MTENIAQEHLANLRTMLADHGPLSTAADEELAALARIIHTIVVMLGVTRTMFDVDPDAARECLDEVLRTFTDLHAALAGPLGQNAATC